MAKLSCIIAYVVGVFLFVSSTVIAQQIDESQETMTKEPEHEVSDTRIPYYSDNKTNSIPYFENRFRIDAELDEITMLFYRRNGSRPVILVMPDGKKLRVNDFPKDQVEWADEASFDMIRIKKPMPGPWQALGEILPESQILAVTDVRIEVEPLPEIILSGETLKVTGTLFNGKDAIDTPRFREVVQLEVEFNSTNNAQYDNFGAGYVNLTTFRDDGKELDEYASDGVFTGEFELAIPNGEWQPIFRIILPMATRELKQKPVLLQKTPITITVDVTTEPTEAHQVYFNIDPTYVDPSSLIFQGKITYPDRQDEPFSIMDGEGLVEEKNGDINFAKRVEHFGYTEPGVHRILAFAYGKTLEGREFRLAIPEFTFNVELSLDESMAQINQAIGDFDQIPEEARMKIMTPAERAEVMARELQQIKDQQQAEADANQKELLIIIGIVNGVILLVGLGVIFGLRYKKKKAQQAAE